MVNLSEIKLQKNRGKKNIIKKYLKFGDKGLVILNSGRIELIHIFFLKKIFKKLFKKKRFFIIPEFRKIWLYLEPNHIIQKKSKNSRMGKGKGLFERKLIRVKQNKIFMEFKGFSLFKINKILLKIKKKLNIKLKIIIKNNFDYTFNLWSKNKKYIFYYDKYLN